MKAFITTLLLLGSSTAALADSTAAPSYHQYEPDSRYDGQHDGRFQDDRFQDDRFQNGRFGDRFDQRRSFRRPVMLAHNVSLMRQWNRDHRPMLIDIDQRAGRFERLRIDRQEGRMFVESVVVQFANGGSHTFTVNQALSARQPSITIDLDGRVVTAMHVNANTMRGRATFDVIGLRR